MPLSEFRAQMATKFGIKNIGVAKNSWSSVDPLEIADLDWTREKDGDERCTHTYTYGDTLHTHTRSDTQRSITLLTRRKRPSPRARSTCTTPRW